MRALWSVVALSVGCGGHATTGGSGGAGGAGAGGSGGGATVAEMIDTYCARLAALGCTVVSEPECRVSGRTALDEAGRVGCGAEFEDTLRCATAEAVSCDQPAEILCSAEINQLEACTSGIKDCVHGTTSGPRDFICDVTCLDYSAQCVDDGVSTTCTCTAGPAAGQTYAASSCDEGINAAAGPCS